MDKNPRKDARRVFRQYGGTQTVHRNITQWAFPDGFVLVLEPGDSFGAIASKIKTVQERYGVQRREMGGLAKVGRAPRLDLENLTASDHAKERLRLMQSQRTVTFRDVLHVLRLPERVLWSEKHNSWVWVRDDLAIAVRDHFGGGHIITTVLWSKQELWDSHPRPKGTA